MLQCTEFRASMLAQFMKLIKSNNQSLILQSAILVDVIDQLFATIDIPFAKVHFQ
jgi:hypothetical protein